MICTGHPKNRQVQEIFNAGAEYYQGLKARVH
jgi:hypothetical protein